MTECDTSKKAQSHTFLDRKEELKQIRCSCCAPESRSVIGGPYIGKTKILREVESLLWEELRPRRRSKKGLQLIPVYFNIDHRTVRQDSVNILLGKIVRKAWRTVNNLQLPSVREKLDQFQPSVDDPEVFRPNGEGVIKLFDRDLEVFRGRIEKALNCSIRLVFLLDNAQNASLTENVRYHFAEFLVDLLDIDSTDTESLRSNVFIITCDDEVDKLFPSPHQLLQYMPATKLYAFSGHVARHEFVVPLLENRFGEVAQENKEQIDQIALAICEWAGGHPKLLEHCVNQAPLEDIDIDISWIQQLELDEHVQELLNSCIQSCDLRARILKILAEEKEPVPKAKIFEKVSATNREVWRHLEALRYHGLVQALDEGYVLAGEIFRLWLRETSPDVPPEEKEERIRYLQRRHRTLKERLKIVELELDGSRRGDINLIMEKGEIEKELADIEAELEDLGVKGI